MSAWLPLILFFSMIITCYSAIYLEPQLAIPGHENQCYDRENNVFYKKGEDMKMKINFCGRKLCGGYYRRGQVHIETHTCGKYSVPPGCHHTVDLNYPYPDCCGKIVCPEVMDLDDNNA